MPYLLAVLCSLLDLVGTVVLGDVNQVTELALALSAALTNCTCTECLGDLNPSKQASKQEKLIRSPDLVYMFNSVIIVCDNAVPWHHASHRKALQVAAS